MPEMVVCGKPHSRAWQRYVVGDVVKGLEIVAVEAGPTSKTTFYRVRGLKCGHDPYWIKHSAIAYRKDYSTDCAKCPGRKKGQKARARVLEDQNPEHATVMWPKPPSIPMGRYRP